MLDRNPDFWGGAELFKILTNPKQTDLQFLFDSEPNYSIQILNVKPKFIKV